MYIKFLLLIHVICYDFFGSVCFKGALDRTSLGLARHNTKISVYSGCSILDELA